MRNKRFFHSFLVLLAAVMCVGGFSVTAYAQGDDTTPTDDSNVKVEAVTPQHLTPEGNMTLVDDISGDAAGDKQFIVVQSKGGSYFYIVIDNAADGNNTVHFLNQVDEADLLAIIEDDSAATPAPAICSCTDKCEAGKVNTACPVCATTMTACNGKAAEPEPEPPTEQPKEKSNMGGLVLFLAVALLGVGGALYYVKVMKPKQAVKGNTSLDDFEFEEYDEDEPEQEEQEDEEE